jgi:DNA repair exonuclease SbcCD ATPase subunit
VKKIDRKQLERDNQYLQERLVRLNAQLETQNQQFLVVTQERVAAEHSVISLQTQLEGAIEQLAIEKRNSNTKIETLREEFRRIANHLITSGEQILGYITPEEQAAYEMEFTAHPHDVSGEVTSSDGHIQDVSILQTEVDDLREALEDAWSTLEDALGRCVDKMQSTKLVIDIFGDWKEFGKAIDRLSAQEKELNVKVGVRALKETWTQALKELLKELGFPNDTGGDGDTDSGQS